MKRNRLYVLIKSASIFILLISSLSSCASYGNKNMRVGDEDINEYISEDSNKPDTEVLNDIVIANQMNTPEDIKRILERGKLIVGIHMEDQPPCVMTTEEGKLYGSDIDLAKDIALQLGVDVEFNRTADSFDELYEMINQGEVDLIISKFSRTLERAKNILYSQPYMKLRQTLIINKVDALQHDAVEYPIDFLKEANVKIGVLGNSSYVDFAKDLFKNAEIVEFDQWDQAVDSVVEGQITAALYDDIEIMRIMGKKPDVVLYTSVYVLTDRIDPICIGVSPKDTQLHIWIDTYLETMEYDKDLNTLIKEYPMVFGEEDN